MIIYVTSFILVGRLAQNLMVKADMQTDTVLHSSYKLTTYKPTVHVVRLVPQSR
jgi:hypothetical protein